MVETEISTLSSHHSEVCKKNVEEKPRHNNLASIGTMVLFVAHEMRNALQNIRFGSDAMRMEIGEDPGKLEIIQQIDHGVDSLAMMVKELLEYSKPISLRCSRLPVRDLVDKALNAASGKLSRIKVHQELELPDREVVVDHIRIVQVLINFILNAVESMSEGGDLKVGARFCSTGGMETLTLFITDNGCGIAEEDLERIQLPFVTTKNHGVGLGIPICKKIIDAHNGELRIKSTLGEGTTVKIRLPICEE